MGKVPDRYDIREREAFWQRYWEEKGLYRWDPDAPREQTFSVDTPPPTVSGSLHMGHVFSYTQCDIVVRYKRMRGLNIYYPFGFDDNGLPTERLVEKIHKVRAFEVGREKFIELCLEESRKAEEVFKRLWQSLGLSVDWSQSYSTIDEHCRRISQWSFIRLYQEGHVYRKASPTLWDPVDRTAIAQAEVVDREIKSTFNDVTFFVEGSERTDRVVIATTRPELIPACVAVFCHPDDERYNHLAGKYALTPLFSVPVPILTDHRVDPEKGTGIVMCCTFGDTTDIAWWQEYRLPLRQVIGRDGHFLPEERVPFGDEGWESRDPERARKFYRELAGLKVEEARRRILAQLADEGLLGKQEEIVHTVGCAERSGAPLEILVTDQWFLSILDKKEEFLRLGEQIEWHPPHMFNRYRDWVENLQWDWCISRQRYYGVPFPVWYEKSTGKPILPQVSSAEEAREKLPVNPLVDLPEGYSADQVLPEQDVMDTWATSSLTPNINAFGLSPQLALEPERFQKLFPMDLRPQAHEIIRTWLFYTVVRSYLHTGGLPWKHAMISGWCLDRFKRKMSKSLGNVVTPEEEVERYGADPIRYWTATSTLGMDTAYDPKLLKVGKKLVTKLFNAARFTLRQIEDLDVTDRDLPVAQVREKVISELVDRWLLSRLHETVRRATDAFERFQYSVALRATEEFFWNDFCDNYLEIVKGRVYSDDPELALGRLSAQWTLFHALHTVLRLFAPILSHLTEEIYHWYFADLDGEASIHLAPWPSARDFPREEDALYAGELLLELLTAVRRFKTEQGVSLARPLRRLVIAVRGEGAVAEQKLRFLEQMGFDLGQVTRAESLELVPSLDGDGVIETDEGNFLFTAELATEPSAAQG